MTTLLDRLIAWAEEAQRIERETREIGDPRLTRVVGDVMVAVGLGHFYNAIAKARGWEPPEPDPADTTGEDEEEACQPK
jgi:hypothetical protein